MESKDPDNPFLPQGFRGRKYVVKSFIVRPRVMILTEDGKEETEILGPQYGVFEAQTGLTLLQLMDGFGVKLRSDGG